MNEYIVMRDWAHYHILQSQL